MTSWREISRRELLRNGSLLVASASLPYRMSALAAAAPLAGASAPLGEFGYGDVALAAGLPNTQLNESHAVLMGMTDDALLKPFRQMADKPAPGADLGGWYCYRPDYNYKTDDAGFAPGSTFGQWVSALARSYAITGSPEVREKVLRLNRLLAEAISANYFELTRFPAYSYDKLVCGLVDSHAFATDPDAFAILDQITSIALPHLPPRAVTREKVWRTGKDVSYTWDESYTMAENLFLAFKRGAGPRYRDLARNYLEDETYNDPLAQGDNPMPGRHAYSYVNALSSAMQAYLTLGSEKYLLAARNGFDLLAAQSYATGGWGPDEQLRPPDSDALFHSLTNTHNSFETPCGAYAHFKLTRYLLRVTRDPRYGDSMERVLYNTVLGSKPLEANGHAFYYSDYNFKGKRVYSDHSWPCCSGTLPQVAADYGISAYLRDGNDVYVNLYLPSTLKWSADGKDMSLTQQSEYPFEDTIRMQLALSHPARFALQLRIPGWAEGASASVNGKQLPGVPAGRFLRIDRKWKSGDRVALTLPMVPRLEAIDPRHPETVALLAGPLVLFALGGERPEMTRQQLLAARRVEAGRWSAEARAGTVSFAPFTALGNDAYTTYLQVASG